MSREFPTTPAVGVFDSGLGGLSVLRHIRACLPGEDLLYFADSGYAPYGNRSEEDIVARSLAIADFLMQRQARALVVACNTATAWAIKALRVQYPSLPLVGVEPGLKPAAVLTTSKIVGVMATERTLRSEKFHLLREQIAAASGVRFEGQACIGLADQVEKGELHSPATAQLVRRYVEPLLEHGADTLVLGCTHYPFVQPLIEEVVRSITSRPVAIVDTGEPVARQLVRLLGSSARTTGDGTIRGFTTASASTLANAFSRLLGMDVPVEEVAGG
jgi:glutamate racemase